MALATVLVFAVVSSLAGRQQLANASTAAPLDPPSCVGGTCTLTFAPSGTVQDFAVPRGVSQIAVTLDGGGGGGGGKGGEVVAALPVTNGEVLGVEPGGAGQEPPFPSATGGAGGLAGGGAGGSSAQPSRFGANAGSGGGGGSFLFSATNQLLLAVGGGGGSSDTGNGGGGNGGAPKPGISGVTPPTLAPATAGMSISGVHGGGPGTSTAGGVGGTTLAPDTSGTAGSGPAGRARDGTATVGAGGDGGSGELPNSFGPGDDGGGGGGGGYFGGGGGGGGAAGGGGGSGYFLPDTSSILSGAAGVNSGDGRVVITYPGPTLTLVASPAGGSTVGQAVQLTATLTFAAPGADGLVQFETTSGGPLRDCPLLNTPNVHGQASCTTTQLPGGDDDVYAVYGGDGGNPPTQSNTISYPVAPAAATVSLTASPANTAPLGASVQLSTTVTGTPFPPTGTVSFESDGEPITGCSDVPIVALHPTTTCSTNTLTAGTHQLTVAYSGDHNYLSASSAAAAYVITASATAEPLIVSELRLAGPDGAADQYVTLYNNSGGPLSLNGWSLVYGTDAAGEPVVALPNGTLPAYGHITVAGSAYSLEGTVPADLSGLAASPDQGVRVVAPNGATSDAVGFVGSTGDLHSGTPLSPPGSTANQYAYVRAYSAGVPVDTGDNVADFRLVAAAPVGGFVLGAPGPADINSPLNVNATAQSTLLDPSVAVGAYPNREYDATTHTLIVRRTITNTSTTLTLIPLRLRITSITTVGDTSAGQAELVVSSSCTGADIIDGYPITKTCLDAPPSSPFGGGLNSTLSVTVPSVGLAPGQSVNVELDFDVAQGGRFSFAYNTEGIPG